MVAYSSSNQNTQNGVLRLLDTVIQLGQLFLMEAVEGTFTLIRMKFFSFDIVLMFRVLVLIELMHMLSNYKSSCWADENLLTLEEMLIFLTAGGSREMSNKLIRRRTNLTVIADDEPRSWETTASKCLLRGILNAGKRVKGIHWLNSSI